MMKLLGYATPELVPAQENTTGNVDMPTTSNPPTTTSPVSHQCRHLEPLPPTDYGWISTSSFQTIPPDAFAAGEEKQDGGETGHLTYLARGHFCGSLIPGKAVPGHSAAYIAVGTREMPVFEYEVRFGNLCLSCLEIDTR